MPSRRQRPLTRSHTTKFYIEHQRYAELEGLMQQSGRRLRGFKAEVRNYFADYNVFQSWVKEVRDLQNMSLRDRRRSIREIYNTSKSIEEAQRRIRGLYGIDIQHFLKEHPKHAEAEQIARLILRQAGFGQPHSTDQTGRRGSAGYIRFRWDMSLLDGIIDVTDQVRESVYVRMTYAASDLRKYMYDNAPWTNHTWRARNGLRADVYRTNTGVTLSLTYGGVPYGVYLEFDHEGRFAIITPTLQNKTDEILRDIAAYLLRRYGNNA